MSPDSKPSSDDSLKKAILDLIVEELFIIDNNQKDEDSLTEEGRRLMDKLLVWQHEEKQRKRNQSPKSF